MNFAFRKLCNWCGVARPAGSGGTGTAEFGGKSHSITVQMTPVDLEK